MWQMVQLQDVMGPSDKGGDVSIVYLGGKGPGQIHWF